MPTRILLADDSMTAQKLGKDILIAAGYDVTAVSNGAVAAKKLADKFAVIILDINMPGYTGIELCEKIRANMDIAKTPVLLTIGKMEHYEPADAQRVKADGVIVKPFEATDLLAAVEKLVKQSAPPVPDYEKTVIFRAADIQEFKDQSYADWKSDAAEVAAPATSAGFDMTHAQASAPAFGMDFADAAPAATPQPAASFEPAASAFADAAGLSPTTSVESSFPSSGFEIAGSAAAPAMAFETSSAGAPQSASAFELSTMESERVESLFTPSAAPEFESFGQAASSSTVPVPDAPAVVTSSINSVDPNLDMPSHQSDVAYSIPMRDPALADRVEMTNDEFVTKVEPSAPDPSLEIALEGSATDMEFEAKVAAAMSGLDAAEHTESDIAVNVPDVEAKEPELVAEASEPQIISESEAAPAPTPIESPEVPVYEKTQLMEARNSGSFQASDLVPAEAVTSEPETQALPEGMHDAELVEQMQAAFANLPVDTAPHIVEEPMLVPQSSVAESVPIEPSSPAPPSSGPDMELASALAAAVGAEAPVAAAGPGKTLIDPNVIAQAVHRAMAKMMPAIMTEVAKELDPENK